MDAIKYPLVRCFKRGYTDFFEGNVDNPYALTPDGQPGMSMKEWQRGFDKAYLENQALHG